MVTDGERREERLDEPRAGPESRVGRPAGYQHGELVAAQPVEALGVGGGGAKSRCAEAQSLVARSSDPRSR